MPLQPPILDDRSFEQIVSQAKLLIPRYAPTWTNQSETDPGITLMELFAWMTEMTLYRLNQVPQLNYIKFLQLLGIELKPAEPAHVDVTFNLTSSVLQTVIIPVGTQIAAAGSPPLVFETDEALIAMAAKLKAIQTYDGFSYSVATTANGAAGQWFYPFGPNAREGAALMLGFDALAGFTTDQINLAVTLYTSGMKPEGHNCDLDLTTLPVASTLAWESWDGRYWNPLSLDRDDSRGLTRSGHIYFEGPGAAAKRDILGNVKESLYWLRLRLQKNGYDVTPRLSSVVTNTVRATQGQTVRDEIVGGSTGLPDQIFTLASSPIITLPKPYTVPGVDGHTISVNTLQLEVDEGAGYLAWQQVDDFFASTPSDSHFVLNRTTAQVSFGDGSNGRIPVANPASPNSNIVARFYRFGGGSTGNVGSGAVQSLQTSITGVDSVTNSAVALGGSDEESLESAKLRAPQQLKSKGRAVTGDDFEYIAEQTPGVRIRRAKALPLYHPSYPDVPIPGVVTVIVVPESDQPNPIAGAATLAIVCAELNQHRLLTSEVYTVAATYRLVQVEALIVVAPNADLSVVKKSVETALTTFFHPLNGGPDGQGWPFGGTIFYSDVYRRVLDVDGVLRVQDSQMVIWLDNQRQQFCRDVSIQPGELLYSTGHQLSVTYQVSA